MTKKIQINTDYFKNMSVTELRKFTLDFYTFNLKNKKTSIKNSLNQVDFITPSGRKIAKGGAMYKEKAAIVECLEKLIKNSTYNNWGKAKKTDPENVLGFLNFKSKITIDGTKRHVRISIILTKKRETLLKNYELGKITDKKKLVAKVINSLIDNKKKA